MFVLIWNFHKLERYVGKAHLHHRWKKLRLLDILWVAQGHRTLSALSKVEGPGAGARPRRLLACSVQPLLPLPVTVLLFVLTSSTSVGRGSFKELLTFVFPDYPFTRGIHFFLSFSFFLSLSLFLFIITQLEQSTTHFGPGRLAFETLTASYLFWL